MFYLLNFFLFLINFYFDVFNFFEVDWFFCCRKLRQIDFRDADDLQTVVYRHQVAPHRPLALSALYPSTIIYLDQNSRPRKVHWVDCSTGEPHPVKGVSVTHKQDNNISEIACAQGASIGGAGRHGNRRRTLPVTTDGDREPRLSVYEKDQDRPRWSATGEIPYMPEEMRPSAFTTDGEQRLYICDANNQCVQEFSVDGDYQGVALRQGRQGFGAPVLVSWSHALSALIVVHRKNDRWFISRVEPGVPEEPEEPTGEPGEPEKGDVHHTTGSEELNIDSDDDTDAPKVDSESDHMEVGAEARDLMAQGEKTHEVKAEDAMDADSGVEDNDTTDGGATEAQSDANKTQRFKSNTKSHDAKRATNMPNRRSSGSRETQEEAPRVKRSVTMETSEDEQDESGIVMDADPEESEC